MEDWIKALEEQESKLHDTGLFEITGACGCKHILREIGVVMCGIHSNMNEVPLITLESEQDAKR